MWGNCCCGDRINTLRGNRDFHQVIPRVGTSFQICPLFPCINTPGSFEAMLAYCCRLVRQLFPFPSIHLLHRWTGKKIKATHDIKTMASQPVNKVHCYPSMSVHVRDWACINLTATLSSLTHTPSGTDLNSKHTEDDTHTHTRLCHGFYGNREPHLLCGSAWRALTRCEPRGHMTSVSAVIGGLEEVLAFLKPYSGCHCHLAAYSIAAQLPLPSVPLTHTHRTLLGQIMVYLPWKEEVLAVQCY